MMLELAGVLNEAQLQKIHQIVEQSSFVDGRLTAGMAAARVKHNQELEVQPERAQLINRILMSSLGHNPLFRSFALPHRMADFIVARYQPGMTYGDHVDDPIMGSTGPRFRSDVSMTVFLNPPETYEGGELVVRTPFGHKRVKLRAGDAVIYPSASVHRVAEVARGEPLGRGRGLGHHPEEGIEGGRA